MVGGAASHGFCSSRGRNSEWFAGRAAGAVDDGPGLGVPVDFLEGEWGARQVFGEALAAFGVDGGEAFLGHGVEASFFVEQTVRGEAMEVRVEDEDRLLKLTKSLFTRQFTGRGPVLAAAKSQVKDGDELVVRIACSPSLR